MAKSKRYTKAFDEGQEAVRRRPRHAPSNPYDDREQPDQFEGWDAGAYSAGISEIYTNGELDKEYR